MTRTTPNLWPSIREVIERAGLRIPFDCPWYHLETRFELDRQAVYLYCSRCCEFEPVTRMLPLPVVPMPVVQIQLIQHRCAWTDGYNLWEWVYWISQCGGCLSCFWAVAILPVASAER